MIKTNTNLNDHNTQLRQDTIQENYNPATQIKQVNSCPQKNERKFNKLNIRQNVNKIIKKIECFEGSSIESQLTPKSQS